MFLRFEPGWSATVMPFEADWPGSQCVAYRALMRSVAHRLLIPALALVAVACAPCHRHPGPPYGHGMGMACGHDTCTYKSMCFSDGAVRANDGVCQACAGGKWVAATGCRESPCHSCAEMMEHGHPHHPPHR